MKITDNDLISTLRTAKDNTDNIALSMLLLIASDRIERLSAVSQQMLQALIECDEAMDYMSEYDIPLMLPENVKAAIKSWEEN